MSVGQWRAAGWGIMAAGLLALLGIWFPAHPAFPAAGLLVTGALVVLWTLSSLPHAWLSKQPHEAAFRSMPTHSAALDEHGNVTLVNEAWRQFAVRNGFRGDKGGVGLNYIELCETATGQCSEEAREVATGIRGVLSGERESFSIEYPCHSPNDQRWFRCLVSRFPGELQGALVTHLDVTEQVKMREQVSELKLEQAGAQADKAAAEKIHRTSLREVADLKAALDEHNIVAICGIDGRILYVNDHFCEISGYKQEELVGSNAMLDEIPERLLELAKGNTWKGEVCKQTRDGRQYWIAETVVPFHDESGNPNQYVIIGTDVTPSHEAKEATLSRSRDDLARSNAMLAEFAHLASHDLQEPLRGVNGCVQLIADRYGDQLNAEGREWVRHAVLNTERMQALIAGLLDLSRVEHDRSNLAAFVDCDGVLAGAIESLRQTISETGAAIEVVGALPPIQGDSRQIGQIFQNLISNSIKFRSARPPRIEIAACETAAGMVEFSVQDNGIGIDPRHANRVFGPFQRLHAQGEYGGSGIGLSIARRIVERHGGRIWVVTERRETGAELRFTLPRRQGAASLAGSARKAKGTAAS